MTSPATIAVTWLPGQCRIRLDRPDAGNAINAAMVGELEGVLQRCASADSGIALVVLEGAPDVFCAGGDMEATAAAQPLAPARLYDLWLQLRDGPFVSIALVRGRANAGGIGFVAAADMVLAERGATFGLSELLFGLYPACVLPFLARRIGRQRAHYLTLLTRPVTAAEALGLGLVDAVDDDAEVLLRRSVSRLRHLPPATIARYKAYLAAMPDDPRAARDGAIAANQALFADAGIQRNIRRYVTEMKFPWED